MFPCLNSLGSAFKYLTNVCPSSSRMPRMPVVFSIPLLFLSPSIYHSLALHFFFCGHYGPRHLPWHNTDLSLAKAGSLAVKLPTADSLTNGNVTCLDYANGGDSSSSDSSDPTSVCAQGSPCLVGDLGVYCSCYLQRSTMEKVPLDKLITGLNGRSDA